MRPGDWSTSGQGFCLSLHTSKSEILMFFEVGDKNNNFSVQARFRTVSWFIAGATASTALWIKIGLNPSFNDSQNDKNIKTAIDIADKLYNAGRYLDLKVVSHPCRQNLNTIFDCVFMLGPGLPRKPARMRMHGDARPAMAPGSRLLRRGREDGAVPVAPCSDRAVPATP